MAYYSSKSEKKEKKDPYDSLKTVFIILGVLIVFYCGGYIVGTELIPQQSKASSASNKIQNAEYDIDSPKITNLMSQLVAGSDCWNIEDYAKDEIVTVKDLSSERIYQVVELGSFSSKEDDVISLEDFEASIGKYFNDGYHFQPEEIDFDSSSCFHYSYDSSDDKFIKQNVECEDVCGPNRSLYKITKAVEENGILKVTVKVLFGSRSESTNFYSDYARTNYLTNDYDDLDSFIDQGGEYLFTFKNVNNHYLFVSSQAK